MTDAATPPAKARGREKSHPLDRVISGGIAGALSRTSTAPIDRVRILYQVNHTREFTLRAAFKTARTIYTATGAAGLWRGNGAALVRVIPYSGLLFCAFPTYESLVAKIDPGSPVLNRFIAGALAGATATTLTYPLDLLRARMAAHWGPNPLYKNYYEGLRVIHEKEGFAALFHGIRPTLMGIVPYSGIGFMTFETLKSKLAESQGLQEDKDLPTLHRLGAGALSGLVAQSMTYPLHVIRRRMQVRGDEYAGLTMRGAARKIYGLEGIGGLFKGITLTYAKGPLSIALGFTLNDLAKVRIQQMREAAEDRLFVPVEARDSAVPVEGLKEERQLHALESLLCGAIAGCTAKSVIAPADRIKICFQVGKEQYSFRAAVNKGIELKQTQGITGLWRGHGATLLRVIPYSGTSYMTYDRYLGFLKRNFGPNGEPNALLLFLAGSMAGTTATTLTYPLDLLRTRLATAHTLSNDPNTRLSYHAVLSGIVNEQGWTKLFAGLRPTVLGIVPYAGLSFMTFETLKANIRERYHLKRDRDIPTPLRLLSGGFAGLVAQSATYPLDIVRRRMQVGNVHHSLSLRQALQQILLRDGWRALYRGLSMNWFKGPISISISFTTNDAMKAFMRDVDLQGKVEGWFEGDKVSAA